MPDFLQTSFIFPNFEDNPASEHVLPIFTLDCVGAAPELAVGTVDVVAVADESEYVAQAIPEVLAKKNYAKHCGVGEQGIEP